MYKRQALHFPALGGVFIQAESEVAAMNMVYGSAGMGVRTMTASSSPGFSLKQMRNIHRASLKRIRHGRQMKLLQLLRLWQRWGRIATKTRNVFLYLGARSVILLSFALTVVYVLLFMVRKCGL